MVEFARAAGSIDCPERLKEARREGRKTVAIVGASIPEALFWACGAAPISLGRLVAAAEADGRLPRDACAGVRTSHDLLSRRWIPAGLIDAVVVAGHCDWTSRLGDLLALEAAGTGSDCRIDPVRIWPLNVSREAPAASEDSRLASLDALLRELEHMTDLPLTGRAFSDVLKHEATIDDLRRQFDGARAASPPALSSSQYYRIVGSLDLADPVRWIEIARTTLGQMPGPRADTPNPRVALAGCPTGYPDVSIVELMEEVGLQIVADDFSLHGRVQGTPPRGGRRAILRWVADQLAVGCGPETRGGTDGGPLLSTCKSRRADGLVWIHYRGCGLGAMEYAALEPSLAHEGIPVLAVEIERIPAGAEALRTRFEAFREQLIGARGPGGA